jgi:hypothetical protein
MYVASTSRSGERHGNFAQANASAERENRQRAEAWKGRLRQFLIAIVEVQSMSGNDADPFSDVDTASFGNGVFDGAGRSVTIVHGNQTNVHHSPGTAIAIGDRASATSNSMSQTDHEQRLSQIRHAILGMEQKLDDLGEGVYEALNQALRMIAKMRVEGEDQETLIRQMKTTIDEVWATNVAAHELKPALLHHLPEFVEAIGVHALVQAAFTAFH